MPAFWIALIAFFWAFVAAPFGFIGDIPKNVKPPAGEKLGERAVQWSSAIFHTAGPLLLALNTDTPWLLFMSSTWFLFGSLVVARRLGAAGMSPGRVYLGQWWRGIVRVRIGFYLSAVISFGALIANQFTGLPGQKLASMSFEGGGSRMVMPDGPLYPWLHDTASYVVLVAGVLLLVAGAHLGRETARKARESDALVQKFTPILAAVLGIAENQIENNARMRVTASGEIEMHVVPPAIAKKLTRANMPAIDAEMATASPEWEIDESSNHELLTVRRVTPETERRRMQLAASGGMFTTDAPQMYVEPIGVLDASNDGDSLSLDLRHKEW